MIKVSRPFAGWLLPATAGGEAIPARIYLHLNFPSRACCQLNPIKPSIMPIQIKEENGGKMLTVHVTGKLVVTDYEGFVPEFKRLVRQYGKLSVLFDMTDFHGWTPGALWSETKVAVYHFSAIDRLAIVGEKRWQQGMASFFKAFTTATVHYFDHAEAVSARRWLGDSHAPMQPR